MSKEAPACERPQGRVLRDRLAEPRRLIQFVGGPRQAGKTSIIEQALFMTCRPGPLLKNAQRKARRRAWT